MGSKKESRIIHKLIDGEATKRETDIIRKKIKSDPEVAEEYERLKAVTEITEHVTPPPAPKDFKARVIRVIRTEPEKKS